jgi:hypothetical protein
VQDGERRGVIDGRGGVRLARDEVAAHRSPSVPVDTAS